MATNIHSGFGEISCDLVVLRRTRSGIEPQIKRKRTPTTDESTKTVTMRTKTGIKTLKCHQIKLSSFDKKGNYFPLW